MLPEKGVSGSLAAVLALTLGGLALAPIGAAIAAHSPTHFAISKAGASYLATSQTKTYGPAGLKTVVESAVNIDLKPAGGGTITFNPGVFDLGSEYLRLEDMTDITIEGQGMDVTTILNSSSALDDTEPFNTKGSTRVTIRDLTVIAGGVPRTTSDAIDFDRGNNNLVERVKITYSRGKGIIFDGKDLGWTSEGNTVRDCDISGTSNDGIQFLASSNNRVEGCFIHDTVQDGIEIRKSQPDAVQPDNVIVGNIIENAGENGIRIHSSDRNVIAGNTITNSSDDGSIYDGIHISAGDSVTCDDNVVRNNRATDTQPTKTQAYGLNISSPLCNRTFVASNDFTGNKAGEIKTSGTNTQYGILLPTAPTSLKATAVSSSRVDLSWTASTFLGVTGYEIFRNSALLATVGKVPSYSDTTVSPSTTYVYLVRALDPAGNRSGFGNTATVTTPTAGGQTVPPPLCKGKKATIWGTGGPDTLVGTPGRDVIVGRGGGDMISGLGRNDLICAGTGQDKVLGGAGNDVILGGAGNDVLRGGKGRDRLDGGRGKDTCAGGAGKDTTVRCELGSGP
jgi:parallel beta-helix repeat protein